MHKMASGFTKLWTKQNSEDLSTTLTKKKMNLYLAFVKHHNCPLKLAFHLNYIAPD